MPQAQASLVAQQASLVAQQPSMAEERWLAGACHCSAAAGACTNNARCN